MATQAEVIAKAQLDATTINANFEYLDTEVKKKANSSSIGNAALTIKKNNSAIGTFTANATSPVSVNISVPTTVAELSDSGDYAKKTDIVSGITPKGSVAFASLPTPAAANLGWLYNVTDSFTTTAAFVEGAGEKYPAGTNIYVVDTGSSTYKWDVMPGFIDTDTYDSHIANTTIHVAQTDKDRWDAKQDALNFDNSPTENSNNPVKSGGIYTALNGKANKSTTLGGYGITNAYTKTETTSLIANATSTLAPAATTLAGYGITDAYTKTETDAYLTSCFNVTITPLGTSA
jgi:hypothetical protein